MTVCVAEINLKFIVNYFSFKGRSNRSEYWIVSLVIAAIILVPAFIFFQPYSDEAKEYVNLTALISLWPYLAVQVRRWHDRNKSGWWVFINFIPIVGFFWVIIENGFLAGTEGENRFDS